MCILSLHIGFDDFLRENYYFCSASSSLDYCGCFFFIMVKKFTESTSKGGALYQKVCLETCSETFLNCFVLNTLSSKAKQFYEMS